MKEIIETTCKLSYTAPIYAFGAFYIRETASGKFRALLGATPPDGTMTLCLDMEDSDKKQPIGYGQLLISASLGLHFSSTISTHSY